MLKVGIVGAGLNSDYHISFSRRYGEAEIVGIADADLARAEACARRHSIPSAFGSVTGLLAEAAPDVVHVVTPPRTHFRVASEVLEAGRHALVEKPFALNEPEAQVLYELARQRGVRLCPMHNHLFDPCMRRADELIKSGALGTVINVESYYGLNTNIPAFREYPRPNALPWLYDLPGGVYQDFLPHPLYVLLEYTGRVRDLKVMQRSTGTLPQGMPDEFRVLIDGERALGTVTFSFAATPHLHFVRVYGTRMMLEVDINTMTTVLHPVSSLPKAAQKATYNLGASWQLLRSTTSNVFRFATGKLKPYQGMMTLIHRFYDSVRTGSPLPVDRERAVAVVTTMDSIFAGLHYEPLKFERVTRGLPSARPATPVVLVTGATGFVGRAVVKRLVDAGCVVRILARKLSRVEAFSGLPIEIYWGDVADRISFGEAMEGVTAVVHLAAGTSGTEKDSETATLQGTRNLLDLCREYRPGRLVYISSCGVYGIADQRATAVITEDAPLERYPERRGVYSASKQQAEGYVTDFMQSGGVPTVILRPGTVYGPGGDLYTPMMGFSGGSLYVVIGTGSFVLPFVFVDNLADAIRASLERPEAAGQIFNVVDPEPLTKRDYMNKVIRRVQPNSRVVYLPYSALYGLTWLQEIATSVLKRKPFLTRYRLASSQRPVLYTSEKIASRLAWASPITQKEALDRLVAHQVRAAGMSEEPMPEVVAAPTA